MQGPPRRYRSPALRLAHVVRAVDREALQVAASLRRGRGLARGKVVGWKGFTERALGEPCNATPSPHTTGRRGAGMAPRLCHLPLPCRPAPQLLHLWRPPVSPPLVQLPLPTLQRASQSAFSPCQRNTKNILFHMHLV